MGDRSLDITLSKESSVILSSIIATSLRQKKNLQQQMNMSYQTRVIHGMEKLSIPSWYREVSTPSFKSNGVPSRASWRMKTLQSTQQHVWWTQTERNGDNLKKRGLEMQRNEASSREEPYLGWRNLLGKEEIIAGPASRLARSFLDKKVL